MTETARLTLPLIAPEQAQKHVTHNEALLLLDAVVQLRLDSVGEVVPPGAPEAGQSFAVGDDAEGAWSGHDREIAVWTAAGWRFVAPQPGWIAWIAGDDCLLVFSGTDWVPMGGRFSSLGVGTPSDPVNRLAVRTEAALFTAVSAADGGNGDVRLTLNREGADDSAAVIFQSGWSGRAEIGLSGNDDFAFKVSADGASFTTALTLDAQHGFVRAETLLGAAVSEPVVAGGIVAAQTGTIVPQPESGATDEVVTISGGFDGALLVVLGSVGNTLTLRDGLGNLALGGDRVLDHAVDSLLLVRWGGVWVEISFSDKG